jgi:hypothetical protein
VTIGDRDMNLDQLRAGIARYFRKNAGDVVLEDRPQEFITGRTVGIIGRSRRGIGLNSRRLKRSRGPGFGRLGIVGQVINLLSRIQMNQKTGRVDFMPGFSFLDHLALVNAEIL